MLGNGGASEEMRVIMEDTQKKYTKLKNQAAKHRVNDFVFDSKLPVYKHDTLVKTEDDQVAALLKGKSAFSADGQ